MAGIVFIIKGKQRDTVVCFFEHILQFSPTTF
jgi:hypothetical protein